MGLISRTKLISTEAGTGSGATSLPSQQMVEQAPASTTIHTWHQWEHPKFCARFAHVVHEACWRPPAGLLIVAMGTV